MCVFFPVSAERNGIFYIFAIVILKPNIMNDIQLILRGIDGVVASASMLNGCRWLIVEWASCSYGRE